MLGFQSNISEVQESLAGLGKAFRLKRAPGGSKTIGQEIIEIIAATIHERTMVQKLAPDNTPLAALKQSTVLRKIRKGYPPELGVETGEMLDLGEIEGETEIDDDENAVSMTYGKGEEAKNKAEWFQEGRDGVQVPRPFYEPGDDGEERVDAYIDEVAEGARLEFER